MTEQITLEKALQLVTFTKDSAGKWRVGIVHGNVYDDVCGDVRGSVRGDVDGNVFGNVGGNVHGYVWGNVGGNVWGTISGKKWTSFETPREKLARLINEKGDQELIEAFNELEDSDG